MSSHHQPPSSKAFDLIDEALVFHKKNAFIEAKQIYERVLNLPNNQTEPLAKFDAYRLLAKIAIAEKNSTDGVTLLQHAIGIRPDHFDSHFDLANLYQILGNYGCAITSYELGLQIDSNHFQSFGLLGLALRAIGDIERAEIAFRKAIEINPHYADAWCNLGTLLKDRNKSEEALQCFQKAIDIQPQFIEAFVNLSNTLHHLGKNEEALMYCNKALLIQPDQHIAQNNKGNILRATGQLEEALQCYKEAIRIQPNYPEALNNYGLVLQDLKKIDEGIIYFEKAITINPNYAIAYCNLAEAQRTNKNLPQALEACNQAIRIDPHLASAYNNRGVVLYQLKQLSAAIESYDQAIALNPNYPEAYCNAGVALKAQKKLNQALSYYEKAISLKPNYPIAICNQGVVFKELDRIEDALVCYNQAIELDPTFAEAYNNRGIVLKELGRHQEAFDSYHSAIGLENDRGTFHWNLSILYLLLGDFEKGFQEYEWRWKDEDVSLISGKRDFIEPLWLGDQPLDGKTILLYAEQGLGDTIQFGRYIPLFSQLGCQVILEVQAPLVGLFQNIPGVNHVFARGKPLPSFDYQCPMMSLPLAFGTLKDSIPPIQPIIIDQAKITEWESRLGPKTKPRIGLVWSGGTTHKEDRRRSIQLKDYLEYCTDDFEYFSLQKEVRENDNQVLQNSSIRHFSNDLHDFVDTAALISQLDLVISVDTSVAHLAASLNKPTLILIPYAPDWRWMLDRDNSPWYPTVKLYRQTILGNWQTTLQTLFKDLGEIKSIYLN